MGARTGDAESSSRGGGPPRKITGVGLLDPAVPPKGQGPLFPISATMLLRIFAAVLLVGMLVGMFLLFLPQPVCVYQT